MWFFFIKKTITMFLQGNKLKNIDLKKIKKYSMPQLDKVTFLPQFFWLCFFYLGFYYLVVKYFLPNIIRILTLRQKKMNLSQHSFPAIHQENQQVRQSLDTILCGNFSISKNVFSDFLFDTNKWYLQNLTDGNKIQYKTANNSYLKTLGNSCLSQNVELDDAYSEKPPFLKARIFLDNIPNLLVVLYKVSQKKKQQDKRLVTKKTPSIESTPIAKTTPKKSKKIKK